MKKESSKPNYLKQTIIGISIGVGIIFVLICLIVGIIWYLHSKSDSNTSNNSSQTCSEPQIKGNISLSGEKIYHNPGDEYYSVTQIDTSKGERYFCTSQEAESAGWRHSKK